MKSLPEPALPTKIIRLFIFIITRLDILFKPRQEKSDQVDRFNVCTRRESNPRLARLILRTLSQA
jgi:hypothetical protein